MRALSYRHTLYRKGGSSNERFQALRQAFFGIEITLFSSHGDSYIPHCVTRVPSGQGGRSCIIIADAGGTCDYGESVRSYAMVSIEALADADPDVIIVMEGTILPRFSASLRRGSVTSKR